VRTNIINITLSYKHTLYTEVAYINCFTNNLNIYAGKTLVLVLVFCLPIYLQMKNYIIIVVYL